jgi:hypothetical protein
MRFFGAIVGIIIVALSCLIWNFNRPPIKQRKLDALPVGADQNYVRKHLGTPDRIYNTNRTWIYSRFLGWSIVYIYFDEKGKFERHRLDY